LLSGGITASVKNFIRERSDSIPASEVRSGNKNRPTKYRYAMPQITRIIASGVT
jgi:hypothetical protein